MLNFLAPLVSIGQQWLSNKAAEKQAIHERKINAIKNEADWDTQQATNAATSWKDEWFTIVLSIPMICAFIPDLVPYIERGFVVLNEMPDYYKYFLGAAIASSFGVKALTKWGQ